jgi:hypothetical protein
MMVLIAVAVGVGIVYATQSINDNLEVTGWEAVSGLLTAGSGVSVTDGDVVVSDGSMSVTGGSLYLHSGGDVDLTGGNLKFHSPSDNVKFDEEGYLQWAIPNDELGAVLYSGHTLPGDSNATTNFTMWMQSKGMILASGDTGTLIMGDYDSVAMPLTSRGASLVGFDTGGTPRASLHVSATGMANEVGGGAETGKPLASLCAMDEDGIVRGSFRVFGDDEGPFKVRMGNSSGAEVVTENHKVTADAGDGAKITIENGDVVIRLGDAS